jgi:hypothetical protein
MPKKMLALNLAIVFLLAGFFCWTGIPSAKALSSTNASADLVLGQPDMTSSSVNQGSVDPSANKMHWPNGVWTDGKKLIIADFRNNRVLIYNSMPTSSNANADVVIGQQDFTHASANQGGGSPAANTLYSPYTVSSDGIRLFVADTGNNRILIYNTIPTSNNVNADFVVGQADFTHNEDNQGVTADANTLTYPYCVHTDGTKLFITDGQNNRILIYNTIPSSNNARADVVVGQVDFTHDSANQGSSSATANGFDTPCGVFTFNGKMYVTDAFNNRVLIFNSVPTANNASANIAVGQGDLVSENENQGSSLGANTLYIPYHTFTDGVRLFISDYGNNRVLIYNSLPTASNMSADTVIGQASFTTNLPNQGGSVGANTLTEPTSLYYGAGKLFLGDPMSDRILIYSLDAPWTLQNKKSQRLSNDTTVKRKKTTLTFSGKKTGLGKKGRVQIFLDGVLKKTVKAKKNGKWTLKLKEGQTSVNRLYQFKYFNTASVYSGLSDQYNVYISGLSRSSRATSNPVPVATGGSSQKNEINPTFWGIGAN